MARVKLGSIYNIQSNSWNDFENALQQALQQDTRNGKFTGDIDTAAQELCVSAQTFFKTPSQAIRYFDHQSFIGNHAASIYATRLPSSIAPGAAPVEQLLINQNYGGHVAQRTLEFVESAGIDINAVYNTYYQEAKRSESFRPDIKIFLNRVHKSLSGSLLAKVETDTPNAQKLAAFVIQYNLSASDKHQIAVSSFIEACKFLDQMKTRDTLPDIGPVSITLDGKPYTLSKLPHDDVRALFIGKISGCCLSVGDQGAGGAIQVWTEENAALYVLKNSNDKIMGQARVWRGKQPGEMVIDAWVGPSAQNPTKATIPTSIKQDCVVLERLALALKDNGATNISFGQIFNPFSHSFLYPVLPGMLYEYIGGNKAVGYSDASERQFTLVNEDMSNALFEFRRQLMTSTDEDLVKIYNSLTSDQDRIFALHCASMAQRYNIPKMVYTQSHRDYEANIATKIAAFLGDTKFLDQGVDLTIVDEIGNLITYATIGGQTEAVQLLLQKGIAPNPVAGYTLMSIHIAARFGNLEAVKLLASAMREVDVNANLSETLLIASYFGHHNIISCLVGEFGVDVNSQNPNDYDTGYSTPLTNASESVETMEFLISLGANIYAAAMGDKSGEFIKKVCNVRLLQYVMNHAAYDDSAMPLMFTDELLKCAAQKGAVDVMRLLNVNADTTVTVKQHTIDQDNEPSEYSITYSLLEYALRHSSSKYVIKYLLDHETDIYPILRTMNAEYICSNPHFASLCDYAAIKKDEAQTQFWNQVLSSALRNRDIAAIRLLLERHLADTNAEYTWEYWENNAEGQLIEVREVTGLIKIAINTNNKDILKLVTQHTCLTGAGIVSLAQKYPFTSPALLELAEERDDFAEYRHMWYRELIKRATSDGIDALRALQLPPGDISTKAITSALSQFIADNNSNTESLLIFALEVGADIDLDTYRSIIFLDRCNLLQCMLAFAKEHGEFTEHEQLWTERIEIASASASASLIRLMLSYGLDNLFYSDNNKFRLTIIHYPELLECFIAHAKTSGDVTQHKGAWIELLYSASCYNYSDKVCSIINAGLASPRDHVSTSSDAIFVSIVRYCSANAVSAALAVEPDACKLLKPRDLANVSAEVARLLVDHIKSNSCYSAQSSELSIDPDVQEVLTILEYYASNKDSTDESAVVVMGDNS